MGWKESDLNKLPERMVKSFTWGKSTTTEGKQRKKQGNEESRIQQACIKWFATAYPGLWQAKRLHAIPNGGKRSAATAAIMKREGVVAGVWDIHLTLPRGKWAGLWIETKVTTDLTEEQITFRETHKDEYQFVVIRSVPEFIDAIKSYLAVTE